MTPLPHSHLLLLADDLLPKVEIVREIAGIELHCCTEAHLAYLLHQLVAPLAIGLEVDGGGDALTKFS